jgi:hypothetical protein
MANDYVKSGTFELRFWLQVLGDHARFLYQALVASEREALQDAEQFIEGYDRLLHEARQTLTREKVQRLAQEASRLSMSLRTYKLAIIEKQLTNRISIHFTASFVNHMVNELEEFLRILDDLKKGEAPPLMHEVHHHLLWLQDAYGHSSAIHSGLDMTEYELLDKSNQFTKAFKALYLKAEEMAGFLRTSLNDFPALRRFNHEVDIKMTIFKEFLKELEELELKDEILDILSPLIADHMAREECYYLLKLAESRGVTLPACDPTKPRVEQR